MKKNLNYFLSEAEILKYTAEGVALISPEKEIEWGNFILAYSKQNNARISLPIALSIIKKLNSEEPIDEVMKSFMASIMSSYEKTVLDVIEIVKRFSPRGIEFYKGIPWLQNNEVKQEKISKSHTKVLKKIIPFKTRKKDDLD